MEITKINVEDIERIRKIAFKTWPVAYKDIMDLAQMDYMLDMMYSVDSMQKQFADGHQFWICIDNSLDLGFISVEPSYQNEETAKIQKLYVLPDTQGKGFGKSLLEKANDFAKENNYKYLILNVNRNNKAIDFYHKNGFEIIDSRDVPIGNGYFMYDYIMRKSVNYS